MSDHGPAGPPESQASLSMSSARASVLEYLRERGRLCTVKEVAEHFELHPNTVREHLDALLDNGLVVRESSSPSGRGRPALQYRASTATSDAIRDYELLTEVLADQISRMPEARDIALAAGKVWGERSAAELGGDLQLEALPALIGRLGFEPTPPGEDGVILLRSCPILDAARRHPEVVCTVHEGFARALVEAAGEDGSDVTVVPWGAPKGCILHIGALASRRDPAMPA